MRDVDYSGLMRSLSDSLFAGVVPIAHNSGGPKADIVSISGKPCGFLCTTAQEYADAVTAVLCMEPHEREAYSGAARK